MTERFADRRRSRRIDVVLPVILENARAVTRDASASGVFFWKRGTFMYGESIRFAIERMTASGRMLQKCRGVVIRTEPDDNGVGVAARITESTTVPVATVQVPAVAVPAVPAPGFLSAIEELRELPREEPRNSGAPKDDALASAIETAKRWSSLLRKKALEARDELREQQMLEWDISPAADTATARDHRVRVCSVKAVGLRLADVPDSRLSEAPGVDPRTDLHGTPGVRIDLETCVANASPNDRASGRAPSPGIVVRTRSVQDEEHPEREENCYDQVWYSDPTRAFEAFLAVAGESAFLINLELLEAET
jgi:hypothetical protein